MRRKWKEESFGEASRTQARNRSVYHKDLAFSGKKQMKTVWILVRELLTLEYKPPNEMLRDQAKESPQRRLTSFLYLTVFYTSWWKLPLSVCATWYSRLSCQLSYSYYCLLFGNLKKTIIQKCRFCLIFFMCLPASVLVCTHTQKYTFEFFSCCF